MDNVNYKELGLYFALNKTVQELKDLRLSTVCPTRKYTMAKPLTMVGNGTKVKEEDRFA